MFRSRAERKVEEAGYDPARLPPGQYLTEKWPVLHAGTVPQTDLATWDRRVFGEVENPITLSWEELTALPTREITTDIHCVTRWSRFDTSFKGVHWSELAKLVQPKPTARFVVAHAEQDFTANVPLSTLEEDEALLAYEADGEPPAPDPGIGRDRNQHRARGREQLQLRKQQEKRLQLRSELQEHEADGPERRCKPLQGELAARARMNGPFG